MASRKVRVHHITRQDIIDLLNKEDNQILRELVKPGYGFQRFLKGQDYFLFDRRLDYEVFENLMEVSSRGCGFRWYKEAHTDLVAILADCQEFLITDAMGVLEEWVGGNRHIKNMALFIKHYAIVLRSVLKSDHACSNQIASYAFPMLQNAWNVMKARRKKVPEDVVEAYEQLCQTVDRGERSRAVNFAEDDSGITAFRQLSIFPAENDVLNVQVEGLPRNVIDRPYESVDHYLSVFFRLTREDMLRSFRSSIKVVDNPTEAHRFSCKLYESATVRGPPKFTPDGVAYKLCITSSKPVEWAKKDVLLQGSIVVLTPDNFRTAIFGIVRDVKAEAGRGTTAVATILLTSLQTMLQEDLSYVMIEPDAYFECYKHVLSAIKSLDEENFPLADFFVFFRFDNSTPDYLHQTTEFCLYETIPDDQFHKLFLPDELNSVKERAVPSLLLKEFTESKTFDPLFPEKWPSAEELKLDSQQYEAYVKALTSKVAVIQGPPGTGKTFIGVKVVKALLMNGPRAPIIVCCLTNHALDQFLEHIYTFNKNVVRLGGQSQSTVLEPNILQNLIYAYKDFKNNEKCQDYTVEGLAKKSLDHLRKFAPDVLKFAKSADYDARLDHLRYLSRHLSTLFTNVELCERNFLEDSALNMIVDSDAKDQLRSESSTESRTLTSSTMEWLSCSDSKDLRDRCLRKFKELDSKGLDMSSDQKPTNVWHLSLETRYQWFYHWRKGALAALAKSIEDAKEDYKVAFEQNSEPKPDVIKGEILSKARVIGVTTTGAGKFRSLLEFAQPKVLIIEEAAEVLESHTIAALLPSIEHVILIGDHKQLRPLPHDHELAESFNLKISMFERLFDNGCPSATLSAQHRMRPCFADLLVQEQLYTNLTSYKNVYEYPEIRGIKSSMFFFNHSNRESGLSSSTSICNRFEAAMVVSFARYLVKQGYGTEQMTIIATYSAQVPLIQEFLLEEMLEIYVTTVDNYQGEEKDIVLVSFVRNNDQKIIGFLRENNRVCVALSRAKMGMFCFGNFEHYAEKSPLWREVVTKLEAQGAIGDALPLKCAQHEKEMLADSPEKVLAASKNGCSEKCGYQLGCGHPCQRKCHSDDRDHLSYKCPMPCERLSSGDKKCPRLCFQRCKRDKKWDVLLDCGHPARRKKDGTFAPCDQEEQKCLPCLHVDTVICSRGLSGHKCRALVPVVLPCGHKKSVECHRKENVKSLKCEMEKTDTGPCGHAILVPCGFRYYDKKDLLPYCKSSCGARLKCGHECMGRCSWCVDFGIHALCREPCGEILGCGHRCSGLCGSPCPPCSRPCSMACVHPTNATCQSTDCLVPPEGLCRHVVKMERCINNCNRPCRACERPCPLQCHHRKCNRKCSQRCEGPCDEKCDLTLLCGHPCSGYCGDICPTPCVRCLGIESDERFVELLNCHHVVPSSTLKSHLQDCVDCFTWPDCPECSVPIFASFRHQDMLCGARERVLEPTDERELDEVQHLQRSLFGVLDSVVPVEFSAVNGRITTILVGDLPSSGTLLVLKHCLIALSDLMAIKEAVYEVGDVHVGERFETLLMWISNHLEGASYQQLDELKMAIEELQKLVA